jgi:hypothetical protein
VAQPSPTPHPRRPGDLLLHPLAVLAVAVLVINDHLLKALVPGLLTGKLSDIAGLVFFPLLAVSAVEVAALGLRRRPPDRRRLVLGAIVATGLVFGLVKTTAVGSAVFAWSLGAAQWLAGAGPLRGDGPYPVAVTTDPGDLVALVALVGAWWVARPRDASRLSRTRWRSVDVRRRPSRPALLMLVVASFATVASGAAVQQYSSATYEEHIHFDANHSTVTRHLSFDVDNHDSNVRTIMLSAGTSPDDPSAKPAPRIAVSVIPDQPADKMTSEFGRGPMGDWGLDLTGLCSSSCRHGATIVARSVGQIPTAGLDVKLEATLSARGGPGNAKLDTQLALRNDAEQAFAGNPTSLGAKTQGKFRVTAAAPKAHKRLEIHIAADALKAPLAYPLVGTVTMYVAEKIEFADVPGTIVSVGDTEIPIGDYPLSADLLSHCRAGRACKLTLVVSSEYTPTAPYPNASPSDPRAGFADITWHIDVRIQAFDGRPLPADAVSIINR